MPRGVEHVVAIAVLAAGLGLAGCGWFEPEKPAWTSGDCDEFRVPAKEWDSAKNYADGTDVTFRQLIADRLVECRTLEGMRYVAVRKLLGSPDERGRRPLELSYWLGDERSAMAMDSEYLQILFDDRRRVRSVDVGG